MHFLRWHTAYIINSTVYLDVYRKLLDGADSNEAFWSSSTQHARLCRIVITVSVCMFLMDTSKFQSPCCFISVPTNEQFGRKCLIWSWPNGRWLLNISWTLVFTHRGQSCGLQLCFDEKKKSFEEQRMFPSCFFPVTLLSAVEPVLEIIWASPGEVIAFSALWCCFSPLVACRRAKEPLDRQPTHVWTEKPLRWLSEAKSSACWCTPITVTRLGGLTHWVRVVTGEAVSVTEW